MYQSNESLIVILVVGIVAGWLAGQIVRGGGFGLIGDLIVGIIGAFIGDWLLPRLNIHFGAGTVGLIVNATIGAMYCSFSSGSLRAGVVSAAAGEAGSVADRGSLSDVANFLRRDPLDHQPRLRSTSASVVVLPAMSKGF
jgi:uncharacterized membrane protein YeaQ/YmgE (transglycosylase-associated protein family)